MIPFCEHFGQQLQFCFNITDKFSLLKCSKLAPIFIPPIAILDIIIIMFGMPVRLQTQNLFQLLLQAPVFFSKSVNLLSLWRLNWWCSWGCWRIAKIHILNRSAWCVNISLFLTLCITWRAGQLTCGLWAQKHDAELWLQLHSKYNMPAGMCNFF